MSKSKPQNPLPVSPSQFSHSVAKLAVAQILRSIGFKSSKSSALETLTRIATLFLQSLFDSAASHANFSFSHSNLNVFDIIHAIEDLSLPFGFVGASDINRTYFRSTTIQDLQYFIDNIDEVPFPRRVPRYVQNSGSSVIFSGKFDSLKGNDERGPHIPKWLPDFPEIRIDDVRKNGKESLWEEKKFEWCPPVVPTKMKKVKREIVLQGRRDRVKFRLGMRRRNVKVGGLDDLELRNGVCRGGKRVCLIERVDIKRFFQDD
ncbi:unnamed protein product [Amaranthus hypochondriacus]